MGSSPTPTPSSPTYVPYVPSFPFYDAEPYWPKRSSGSGSGGSGGGANIGEMLPYYYHVGISNTATFYLSTSPFTDVSNKTLEQLDDMSISFVTESSNKVHRSIDVHVSDGLYFCCMLMTTDDIAHCKAASDEYLDDYEWGSYQLGSINFVYVTGPTNIGSDISDELDYITISDSGHLIE